MKKLLALILCTTLLFSMTACNSEKPGNKDEQKDAKLTELKKITISEPVRGILWAPVHLAKELGYFEEQGLDVDIVTVQGDAPTAPVLSGDAQFGLFGPEMILGFNEKGQGTKLLITATKKFPYTFLSNSKYDSIESLKGTAINGADSGSSPRQFVRSVLKSGGLNPDADANYVRIPNSGIIAAFENNDIAATYASPESRQLLLDSGAKMLVDMYKPEVHNQILGSKDYEMYITFAKDDYIKENPEIVQKYVNAVYKATLWLNAHTVEEVTEAIRPSFSDNKNLEQTIKEIKDNGIFSETGGFTDSGFKAINKMAKEAGIIKNDVKKEQAVDESFIKKAQESIKLD
ncbi:NMT1/THI5-like domain-containing protein [Gottschalkia acidurici 9a]|uniref:NMT1/THI5-like domain-containing protein n=1 Tax=Gottschalkia acidurici (strain ATCC 7906 / DSM 604 / BCRC 14475 / CIP 104303 / KCTC 5404 / NCIMB 10678 / 9a) TaxID=1128398 RepID=K0AZF4_GOTA9|nr:ABC transporter substrate-binding protein [Gottschalkia acidurici]AFS78167.1 NMT1/THI5-like domain-containing protein [Gottschalkia acidurici 9a]